MEKYRKISLDESRNVGHSSLLGDFITEWKKKETFIGHDFAKNSTKVFTSKQVLKSGSSYIPYKQYSIASKAQGVHLL